jgi:hypothetical protein
MTGRNEEAKTAFEKAALLDPQNENYRKSLKSLM